MLPSRMLSTAVKCRKTRENGTHNDEIQFGQLFSHLSVWVRVLGELKSKYHKRIECSTPWKEAFLLCSSVLPVPCPTLTD